MKSNLILQKETKFDQIREQLMCLFFGEAYWAEQRLKELLIPKTKDVTKIIIYQEK